MKLPIKDIKPNPDNPRTIKDADFNKLVTSLRDFPEMLDARPLVLNKDHIILGGNMRYKAAQDAGLTELPVKIVDWSEEKQREFVIKDNVSGGEWDWDALANEWDAQQLDDWGLELPAQFGDEEVDEDEAPEVDTGGAVSSVLSTVYQLGRHRVMCGDSTSIDAVECLLNNNKIDLVFTDPPYGVDYQGINNDDRGGLYDLLDQAFNNYNMNMKAGASIYVFHSDKCADIFHDVFRKYFHFSSMMIWVKPALVLSQSDYHSRHEPCMYGWNKDGAHSWYSDRKQTTVWEYGKEHIKGHTTPKPTDMICYALENSSKAGHLVCDLFLGSGSTLIACEQTDRTCYGMELDPKYTDVIRKRYAKFTNDNVLPENWEELTPAVN